MSCIIVLSSDEDGSHDHNNDGGGREAHHQNEGGRRSAGTNSVAENVIDLGDSDCDSQQQLPRVARSREWIPIMGNNSKSPICLVRPIISEQTSNAELSDRFVGFQHAVFTIFPAVFPFLK